MLAWYLAVRERLGVPVAHDLGGLLHLHRFEFVGGGDGALRAIYN